MAQARKRPLVETTPRPAAPVARALACHEADPRNIRLAMTFDELLGDDDTADETADDMIRAIRAWRNARSSQQFYN